MPAQAKPEVYEFLYIDTMTALFNTFNTLYGMGYRGVLSTSSESGRADMTMPDAEPISVAVGDVILYRTLPIVAVVKCMTAEEFTADYDIV